MPERHFANHKRGTRPRCLVHSEVSSRLSNERRAVSEEYNKISSCCLFYCRDRNVPRGSVQDMKQVSRGYIKFALGAAVLVAAVAALWMMSSAEPPRSVKVEVAEPELSALAAKGKSLFEATCATCHGMSASGTDKGPPLVHDIYNPGHHADLAFFSAAKFGVRQHHWRYGDMPPQPQVSEDQVAAIVRYVREVQVANGIRYRPHHM